MDSHVALVRSLLVDNSPLLPELVEIILKFMKRLYEGQHIILRDIQYVKVKMCMLRMEIDISLAGTFFYTGKVYVFRCGRDIFNFKFTINETTYILKQGMLRGNKIKFELGYSIPITRTFTTITLLPYKFY